MYQCAEICFPRKKRVPESFHSNTYRIFDEEVPQRLDPSQVYKDHVFPGRSAEETHLLKTYNNPHPLNVKFIRTNVRWQNAPISHIETKSTEDVQDQWWPDRLEQAVVPKAPYTRDSIQRRDFLPPPHSSAPCTRGGCNPHTTPASSIVPSLGPAGEQRVLEERMSFLHQYNCRRLRDQPYQGKRHGVFVWRELFPASGRPPPAGVSLHSAPSHWPGGEREEQRDRFRSLDTPPPALPPLRHGGRNSLP